MVTLAITLQGRGTIYQFDDRRSAELCPIVQYGDAIFGTGYELIDEYRLVGDLLDLLVVRTEPHLDLKRRFETRIADMTAAGKTPRQIRTTLETEGLLDDLFRALVHVAQLPPDVPSTIVERILSDRETTFQERRSHMAKKQAEGAPPAEKTPKAPKVAKEANILGLPMNTRLTFGVAPDTTGKDKDGKDVVVPGKKYSPNNNPKRKGSKSAERFSKYENNMTFEKAIAAGVTAADIKYDIEHKFVVVVAK